MAEAFLKDKLMKTSSEIEVLSAGTNVKSNSGATGEAIKVMENFEIDLSDHVTHLLNKDTIENAELIIAMTRPHELSISKIQQKR